jgi:putative PIN family toxin of toxin-antitoxin system
MRAPPRVVLDTNAVLSALLFGAGSAARVRAGWQSERFTPLASTTTARELVRVLAHPKFGLAADEQAELLADCLPWVQVVRVPVPPPAVPRCRDPSDVVLLHVAATGKARVHHHRQPGDSRTDSESPARAEDVDGGGHVTPQCPLEIGTHRRRAG